MFVPRNSRNAAVLFSIAGLALASSAWARGPDRGGSIRIPAQRAQPGAEAADDRAVSKSTSIVRNDEGEFGISTENGTTTITVHGKPITLDADGRWKDPDSDLRVERTGRGVRVYRGDKVIASMNENRFPSLGADDDWAWSSDSPRLRDGTGPLAQRLRGLLAEADAPQPPVMLGVTLSSVDEATAEEAKVADPERATLILRVFPGLPADKAGLRDKDIIVQIDGDANAAPDALREALAGKKPGENLRLTVVRDDGTTELTVDLAAYDPERMGAPRAYALAGGGGFFSDDNLKRLEELRAKLARSADQIRAIGEQIGANPDKASVQELIGRMSELAEKMGEQSAELARLSAELTAADFAQASALRSLRGSAGGGASGFGGSRALRFFNDNGAPRAVIVDPPTPPPPPTAPTAPTPPTAPTAPTPPTDADSPDSPTPSAQADERIRQIDRRMERLERMLERLIEERARAAKGSNPRGEQN